jgi:two-component system cell cycle response regulator DivK
MMQEHEATAEKTVLVVDDEALNRKLIRAILDLENIGVIEAADGEAALMLTRKEQPDLILMDIQLPGMSGLEATEALKAEEATKHIPVVILSAGSLPEDDDRFRRTGCSGLILKPFSREDLLQTVTSLLGRPFP